MEINSTTTFIFDFWLQQEIKQLSRVWKKFARSNRNFAQTLITQDHRIEPRRFPFVTRTRGEHRWCHLHLPVSPSTAKDTRVNLPHFAVWRNTIVDDKGCSLSNKERRLIVTRFTIHTFLHGFTYVRAFTDFPSFLNKSLVTAYL